MPTGMRCVVGVDRHGSHSSRHRYRPALLRISRQQLLDGRGLFRSALTTIAADHPPPIRSRDRDYVPDQETMARSQGSVSYGVASLIQAATFRLAATWYSPYLLVSNSPPKETQRCPNCESTDVVEIKARAWDRPSWLCVKCGHGWSPTPPQDGSSG